MISVHFDDLEPVENYFAVEKELEKYSQELFGKPRFLVINKIDLLADQVDKKCQEFVNSIRYKDKYYIISAAMKKGTQQLAKKLNEFLQKQE